MQYSTGDETGPRGLTPAGQGIATSVSRYAAGDCLLGRFRETLKKSGTTCLEIRAQGRIWIEADAASYRSEIESPSAFFSAPASALSIADGQPASPDLPARPVDELLYQSAWFGPAGALLDECQPFDVIQLRHWPNFTRLPHTRHVLPLTSLLSRRPTSLSFAYRMLRIPEVDALRFYSAVTAAGYVRVISSQPQATGGERERGAPEGAGEGSFWSRLFERIAGL